jgi:hypothetical protein
MEAVMSAVMTRYTLLGTLIFLTLASGLWLSHAGRPLNGVIFTVHKLIGLATVVTVGVSGYHLHKTSGRLAAVELTSILITAILFLALFVSGALLSREMALPPALLRIHQVAPLLALAATMASLYLFAGARP